MAIEVEGNTTYSRITDLPEISDLRSGDKILVQASNGTSLFDWSNLLIELNQCAFSDTIKSFNDFLDSYEDSVQTIGTGQITVQDLQGSTLTDAINQLNLNILDTNDTVNGLTTDIESNKASIETLSANNDQNSQYIETLLQTTTNQAATISALSTNIANLTEELNALKARVVVLESGS